MQVLLPGLTRLASHLNTFADVGLEHDVVRSGLRNLKDAQELSLSEWIGDLVEVLSFAEFTVECFPTVRDYLIIVRHPHYFLSCKPCSQALVVDHAEGAQAVAWAYQGIILALLAGEAKTTLPGRASAAFILKVEVSDVHRGRFLLLLV